MIRILSLLRLLFPFAQRPLAGHLADRLNERRRRRLNQQQAVQELAALEPAVLKALCAVQQPAEPLPEQRSSPWFGLSSGLLGAAVGAGLCLIFVKRR